MLEKWACTKYFAIMEDNLRSLFLPTWLTEELKLRIKRKRERKKKNEPSTQNNTALTNEHDYNVRIVIQTQI